MLCRRKHERPPTDEENLYFRIDEKAHTFIGAMVLNRKAAGLGPVVHRYIIGANPISPIYAGMTDW